MRRLILIFFAILVLDIHSTECKPAVFAVGPNIFRLDADETVLVVLSGINKAIQTSVYLQDHPKRQKTYAKQTIQLKQGEPRILPMKVKSSELTDIEIVEEGQSRYLYLVIESKDKNFPFKKESVILVQPSSGYVFIQTDKPIYSPRQTVNIRVIPVDQELKPTGLPIRLEILNPQEVIVERKVFEYKEKFISHSHHVVDRPMFGNWTLRAKYGKNNSSETSIQFEVREYVLPKFEVAIKTNKFILPQTQDLKGIISARYFHGQPVQGFVRMKISIELDGKVTHLGRLEKDLTDTGDVEYELVLEDLLQPLGLDGFADGGRLLLDADVTERATMHTETKEDRTCIFVRSPYTLKLTRSSRYFKPTLTYDVRVDGKYANGQTSKNIPVVITVTEYLNKQRKTSDTKKSNLDDFGRLTVQFDVSSNINVLDVTVETDDQEYADNQAKAVLRARAYSSPSNSYIIVRSNPDVGTVGQNLDIEMITPQINNVAAMHMIVISRGKVVHSQTLDKEGGLFNTVALRVTDEMVPSIRVVGYYILENGNKVEIVPDSLWIDVIDKCANEVTIEPNKWKYQPDVAGDVTVRGEPFTLVGLSMVDAAVFQLNDRHLLTREKLFKTLDKFDLGCGPGGGGNSAGVFMDSGLSVVSTSDLILSKPRESMECKDDVRQRKRREAVANNQELHRRICCSEGSKVLNSSLCYDVAKSFINASSKCRQKFFQCCLKASLCREEPEKCFGGGARAGGIGEADQMNGMFEDIPENIDDLIVRTNFKESTLFENVVIGADGVGRLGMSLPSSITKWMIQAVTVSPKSGFCVVNPVNVTVFKPFYIDVNLPFKAVRGEQLEVKVTVYNFQEIDTAVVVYLYGVTGLCSEALPNQRTASRRFMVKSKEAVSTSYPIVPLEARTYKIKVASFTFLGGDVVEKELYVVAEGKRVTKSHSYTLDPEGKIIKPRGKRAAVHRRKQLIDVDLTIPDNIIKGSESCTASAIGTIMGNSVQTAINGVEGLMRVPTGCGEQAMIRLAPTVYSAAYLSHASPDKPIEEKARKLIQQGYNLELTYRKPDGSFTVWPTRPSSTWLTAFVLKVFCQARQFIDIDANVISKGLDWLKTHQTPEGIFKDPYKVHHQEMIGGVKESVSLTAFGLITLRECYRGKEGYAPGEAKAVEYLESKLENLDNMYALAITTYALSLSHSQKTERANELLRARAVYSKVHSTRHWPAGGANSALAVEATSYALLAQLELRDIGYSHPIINWLTQKRSSKGAFVSTQDTVVGLQAITKYAIVAPHNDLDLKCDFTSQAEVRFHKTLSLKKDNALVQQTLNDVPVGGKLAVEAKGVGIGQLQIELGYNIPTEKDELCRFDMKIACTDIDFNADQNGNCDVCGENCEEGDYDYPEAIEIGARAAMGGKDQMVYSPRRSRVGRQAPRIGGKQDKAPLLGASKKAVCINVCVSSLTGTDTGMSIIDVGLLTGFSAVTSDLDKLKTDKTIDSYELLEGRVILYVEKIPKKDPFGKPLCVKFRARQDNRVGNIQPASVKVYYYYEPDKVSCTEFYRPDGKSGVYQKLCENDVCKCAEGYCPKCYTNDERWAIRSNELMRIACTVADYVYKVKVTKVLKEKVSKGVLQIEIKADLQKVMKPGGDEDAYDLESLNLFIIQSCSCPVLVEGEVYLIMGKDGKIIEDQSMRYQLDDHAFVMKYYDKNNRMLNRNDRRLGHYMDKLTQQLDKGCPQ